MAAVGNDAYGSAALALMHGEGIDTTFVRRIADAPTGVGFITVDEDGDNAIAIALGANERLSVADIDRAEPSIAEADVVLTQLEISPQVAAYAMALARKHGVRTILNPAPAQTFSALDLAHVDILTPNLTEARALSGRSDGDAQTCGRVLRERGVGTVVVTAGATGAWIVDGARPAVLIATHDVAAVVDTTGAGDAFNAALAVALSDGAELTEAVSFACSAGAYSVQSLGTVPSYATRSELAAFVRAKRIHPSEVLQ